MQIMKELIGAQVEGLNREGTYSEYLDIHARLQCSRTPRYQLMLRI